ADSKVGLDAGDVERVMKIRVDTMVPSSRLVPTSLNKGRPVYLEEPGSEVADSIRQLAQKFTGAKREPTELLPEEQTVNGKQRRGLFRRS
ncbi:MAG: hypothetical protein WD965_01995, partial [Actinomycetota bacterium]